MSITNDNPCGAEGQEINGAVLINHHQLVLPKEEIKDVTALNSDPGITSNVAGNIVHHQISGNESKAGAGEQAAEGGTLIYLLLACSSVA